MIPNVQKSQWKFGSSKVWSFWLDISFLCKTCLSALPLAVQLEETGVDSVPLRSKFGVNKVKKCEQNQFKMSLIIVHAYKSVGNMEKKLKIFSHLFSPWRLMLFENVQNWVPRYHMKGHNLHTVCLCFPTHLLCCYLYQRHELDSTPNISSTWQE